MSTSQGTVDYILEQIAGAGDVVARKMFGEYGLYCDGKIFALVCDDELFFKPTDAARRYIGDYVEKPPFVDAPKPYLLIEDIDDSEWLTGLVRASVAELPAPKPKAKSRTR
jgi:TfoX/Sxy family transcriptional regulator of competence genes